MREGLANTGARVARTSTGAPWYSHRCLRHSGSQRSTGAPGRKCHWCFRHRCPKRRVALVLLAQVPHGTARDRVAVVARELVSLAQVPPLCHTTNVPQPRRAEPPDVAIRSSYRCSYTAEYASTSLGGLINQRSSVAGYIVGCPLVRMCSLACFGGGGERSALVSTEGGADRWEIRKRGLPPPSLPIHQNWPPLNHKLDKFPNGMRPNKSWKGFSVSLEHQHQTIRIS